MSFVELEKVEHEINNVNDRIYSEYIVESGDTLYEIAMENNSTVDILMDVNDLSSYIIYPDQVLLIPSYDNNEVDFCRHSTVAGDCIKSIANDYSISPRWIIKYNNLNKIKLAANQVINLPQKEKFYQVKENDDLNKIMRISKKSAEELIILNKDLWLKPENNIYIK